ncbi:hypothetical protein [Soonwooa sp.]|uniref:hypothetical protein n=1 Tax=Soonwooa sp. TaxID=1938592 RepID=UPI00260E966C|nr:hypothetical protein [Soonwooa sp.]
MKYILFLALVFCVVSCKHDHNYINYYNEVYRIDSIYRFKKDTLSAIGQYRKLFKKYEPVQNVRLQEYENFIRLSDKYKLKFGGKKALYKLIPQVAPYWKYKRQDPVFIGLYKKYGIDSLEMERKFTDWKKGLNKQLVDSFSIAFDRSQGLQQSDSLGSLRKLESKKNADLMLWTFKNFGYPSLQKIGLYGNNEVFMPMSSFLSRLAESEDYDYFKTKLLDYIKSGECPPRDYIDMVEMYNASHKKDTEYGIYYPTDYVLDSVKIDRSRKLIGFPSIKQWGKISIESWKK